MNYQTDYDYLFKILLLGDTGVGKSCLILRYTDGTYTDAFISTIGIDFKIKRFELNEKQFKLQIWDPSGSERFRTITRGYYRGAHGIILIYDVTNQNSFDNLKTWIKEIQEKASDDVNVMLIGTKSDLVSQRVIDTETGKKLAEQLGYSFFETSSKENINIDEAFESLTNQIYQRIKQIPQQKPIPTPIKKVEEKKGFGDHGVGKSSLSLRYFEDKFQDSYISTIGVDFKLKTIEMNEKIFKFLVWDYQPTERFRPIPSSYYRGAHGIMILYDTTNQQSFDNIKKWIKQIQDYAKNDVNIILIGTKIDLVSQKVIDTETGEKLAE
ncbi:ras-related protein rabd2a-like [Anaeramoeba ignava]|uniref:Ras-related protein Rab-1 n=1 Tax=Anaeramoeba ignava TaxID=1746090 RepID=A0A9Q0LF78_ANAIG|nr:ras-related protein rabd2a-like [Anaeramoeba ignava]